MVTSSGSLIFSPMLMNFPPLKKKDNTSVTTRACVHTRTDRQTPNYCRVSTGINSRATGPIMAMRCHSCHNLTTGPQPLPKPVLHTVRSSASSFNFHFPLFSLRSPSSCLRLLPRLPVTSILPSIFLSITCFRSHFLRKMWPIQLVFLLFTVCRIFISPLTLYNIYSILNDRSNWSSAQTYLINDLFIYRIHYVCTHTHTHTHTHTIIAPTTIWPIRYDSHKVSRNM